MLFVNYCLLLSQNFYAKKHPPAYIDKGIKNIFYYASPITLRAIYTANNATEIHITPLISFALPITSLRITHESIPNIMPLAIEYVRGIIMIARKAPIVSAASDEKSTFLIAESIRSAT